MTHDPLLFGVQLRRELEVADQVLDVLYDLIFYRPVELFRQENAQANRALVLRNAPLDALLAALRSGRVQYEAGVFSGVFSASISRDLLAMGATFNRVSSVYKIPINLVPAMVTAEATGYATRSRALHAQMGSALDQALLDLDRTLEPKRIDAQAIVGELETGWRAAAKAIEVNPELSLDAAAHLRADYDRNIKLDIKKFAQEEIPVLRQLVRDNALQGYRADRLMSAIQLRYGVTQSKAKFLAGQETSLLVSKFREQRFRETIGDRYIWMTSHDIRVRDTHKSLDGKEFSYDSPPVVNERGEKKNPGEDYGCRCVARPIIGAGRRRATNVATNVASNVMRKDTTGDQATIYLVRHGSTELNEGHRLRGWLDIPLSDLGLRQAQAAAKAIDAEAQVDAIYTSDLQRARETGEAIAAACHAPVTTSPALRPLNFGEWQGQPSEVVDPKIAELYAAWTLDTTQRAPGGESWEDFQRRNLDEVERLRGVLAPGQVVILVTHYRNCAWFDSFVDNGNRPLVGSEIKSMLRDSVGIAAYSVFIYTFGERQFSRSRHDVQTHLKGMLVPSPS